MGGVHVRLSDVDWGETHAQTHRIR
jgi:hypothetical protein